MYYYEVLPVSQQYRGRKPLTYSCEEKLALGQLVKIPLRQKSTLGIVKKETKKPAKIESKPINFAVHPQPLPGWYVELAEWLSRYYPSTESQVLSVMVPSSFASTINPPKKHKKEDGERRSIGDEKEQPTLTAEQAHAVDVIGKSSGSVLLHGATGSGKTRVYIELIRKSLSESRSALVLTPEIGLTPQLYKELRKAFGSLVLLTHSGLKPTERKSVWLQALTSDAPLVIIGPRSALFTPVKKVGLIIVDEAHDSSYKQDQSPYHDAKRAAARLSSLQQSTYVLGSATPSVVDYYTFASKKLPIVEMKQNALSTHAKDRTISMIDVNNRDDFKRSPWISDHLIHEIEESLKQHRQSLIFLNRRGTARLMLCRTCHWQATCPRCDMPYTYHGDQHVLRCHTCGKEDKPLTKCPECKNTDIILRSIGTKMVFEEISRLLPGIRVARFDSDVTKADSLQSQYQAIHAGDIDVIIGTQLLGKGLDLPLLRTVGILNADSALALADYVAEEETYQQISQLIGRVGRGHNDGTVVIQTHHPRHPVLVSATEDDFVTFYQRELIQRETFTFPPFCHLLKISVNRARQKTATEAIEAIADAIRSKYRSVQILGPAPAFKEKSQDRYRWQIVVKSRQRDTLIAIANGLPQNCTYNVDPSRII